MNGIQFLENSVIEPGFNQQSLWAVFHDQKAANVRPSVRAGSAGEIQDLLETRSIPAKPVKGTL